MHISIRNKKVDIDRRTFLYLFDNSIYYDHKDYLLACEEESIAMRKLITLAREANINYALFFAPYDLVVDAVNKENKRIFQGFEGKFTLSIRGKRINLNLVRMVIKDLKIKQAFIGRYLSTGINPHPRFLANSPKSLHEQAQYILDALGLDIDTMRSQRSKPAAMMYVIDQLEKQNILVAIESSTNMPQNMNHADGVSGVYIKDKKFPYLFIANEGQLDFESGAGRKIFTIMYLLVCMFKGRSKVVSLEGETKEDANTDIYEIVEEMLLPETDLPKMNHYTLDELDDLSAHLKVTARAILLRLKHLDYVDKDNYWQLLEALRGRFAAHKARQKELRQEGKARTYAPNISANIIAYHGKAFVKILKNLHGNGRLTQRQINLHLAYGRQEVNSSEVFRKI